MRDFYEARIASEKKNLANLKSQSATIPQNSDNLKVTEIFTLTKAQYFFQAPTVIGNSRFHSWGDAQRLMDASEIVIHVVEREHVFVVFDFL